MATVGQRWQVKACTQTSQRYFEQLNNRDATKRGAVTRRPQPFQALRTIFVLREEGKLQLWCEKKQH